MRRSTTGILLLAATWLPPQPLVGQGSVPPSLEAFVEAYASEHDFNGSILVRTGGNVRYERSFGFANFQFRVPNTYQTKYKIASITKAFTSVLILQAAEEGRIELDQVISTYLPSYVGPARDKVTLHQLLNHTSGIRNYDQVKSADDAIQNGIPNYQAPYTTDQLMARFCTGPLVHEPGTVFDYNNCDYIVLGKILERVYTRTYDDLLKEKILDPLGLTDTGMLSQSEILEGLADTYFFRDDLDRLANDLPVYPENWYAAGSMYSTTTDVAAFADALFEGRLLGPEMLARMIRPGLDDYGYGVWSYETQVDGNPYRVVKRPGQIMGAGSQLYHFIDAGVTVVILSNTGTTDLDQFVAEIGKRAVLVAPRWRSLEPRDSGSEGLTGVWENPATGHLVYFTPDSAEVFHRIGDFCIRDTGVVPSYSLYRLAATDDELLLHYFDYRDRPELLQAPLVFRRAGALPDACRADAADGQTDPARLFELVTRTFDRFYAFFDERGVNWEATKQRYAVRAQALSSDEQLFELLAEMLGPLGDGHVNLTWSDRSFNAGRPRLRARLRDVWEASASDLSEGAFVSAWHRGVLESVYGVLDPGSLRSGAAGAIEWGTIGDTVGYLRINRFSGFTEGREPRPAQYDSLDAALSESQADLASASKIIVDVAMNGGGSDAAAQIVASYFADERRPVLRYEAAGAPSREIIVSPRGGGERRPVLLLTSEVTASAAESFVLMMRAFPHVTHVGGRTRGGLSSLLPKPFPNGFRVTLSYQRVLDAEGTLYEGVGIPPDRELQLFPDGNIDGGFALALTQLAGEP